MTGAELKAWRKRNNYSNQDMLREELGLGSRTTISNWEASDESLPRILELALSALEKCPELKKCDGRRAPSGVQLSSRIKSRNIQSL